LLGNIAQGNTQIKGNINACVFLLNHITFEEIVTFYNLLTSWGRVLLEKLTGL
jgi:hypothetical protein